MFDGVLRVGTRGSALALAQTEEAVEPLRGAWPGLRIEIVIIAPLGDRRKRARLQSLGRGAFVKGIEDPLLRGEIDAAVHSSKDLPSPLPDGLTVVAYPRRADARDVIVNRWEASFDELPAGARLGTSSPRRAGQMLAARDDIEIAPIRGNVDTRLDMVGKDGYDGVVLAAAGLERLELHDVVSEYLSPDLCLPDSGQGALAIEARAGDAAVASLFAPVNHARTWREVSAERAFAEAAGGGCRVPVAAYAVESGDTLRIRAVACLPDGSEIYRAQVCVDSGDAIGAGRAAVEALIGAGADAIMYGADRGM